MVAQVDEAEDESDTSEVPGAWGQGDPVVGLGSSVVFRGKFRLQGCNVGFTGSEVMSFWI